MNYTRRMKELGSWTLWHGLLPPTLQLPIFPRPLSTSGWMSGELSGAEMSFPQTPPLESPWKTPASHLWHEMVQPRPRSSLYPSSPSTQRPLLIHHCVPPQEGWHRGGQCGTLLLSGGLRLILWVPSQIQDTGGNLGR